MAVRRVSYLIRRGEQFYFRRAIPLFLVAKFGRREIKLSLGTNDPREGRRRCRALANAFEYVIEIVELMPDLNRSDIDRLLRRYYVEGIERITDVIELGTGGPHADLDVEGEIILAESELVEITQTIKSRTYGNGVEAQAVELLEEGGYEKPASASDEWDILCHGILRARAEQRRTYVAMLKGEYNDISPKDPLFMQPAASVTNASQNGENKITVGEAIDRFIKEKAANDWVLKTKMDNERVLNWFRELVGNKRPFSSLTTEDVRNFKSLILNLPKNASKNKALKSLTLKEIVQSTSDLEKLSLKTANKYLTMLKSFLRLCCEEMDIAIIPGAKITISLKSNPIDARHPFTTEQMTIFFSSPLYSGCKSASRRSQPGSVKIRDGKYWIPLIALFTGMRLGEIAQLRIEDLREIDSIWFFDVSAVTSSGESKQLKTPQSVRRIPVHEELLRIGLLSYRKKIASKKSVGDGLFGQIKFENGEQPSDKLSKWYGRYLRAIGVKTSKTTFHSFRHTYKDALVEAGTEDSHIYALIGHSDKGVTASYGSKIKVNTLAKDVERISYDLDFSHLYESK